jgi:hypothetical protein
MAASTASPGPSATVAAALRALGIGDWVALAAFADAGSLTAWRDEYLERNLRIPSPEALAHEHPDSPPEALVVMRDELLAPARRAFLHRLPDLIAGVRTGDEVEALAPEELLARFWFARDPQRHVTQLYAAAGYEPPLEASRRPTSLVYRIIDEAPLEPGLAALTWAQVEASTGSTQADQTTWTVRQQLNGTWRIVVDLAFLCASTAIPPFIPQDPDLEVYMRRHPDRPQG